MTSSISVVIPTYNRGAVLLDTVALLLGQSRLANEIIIVDQTQYESGDLVAEALSKLHREGQIHWLRKEEPSIPKAMNFGVLNSTSDWVLFIDDDVSFSTDFVATHLDVVIKSNSLAHVGQIVQPWQQPNQIFSDQELNHVSSNTLSRDLTFAFNSASASDVYNCMAGNLCVSRAAFITAGGFDENFYGVAYRFETEFCKRFCNTHNECFYYSPKPKLDHLHLKSGGTRAHANHLTSTSPVHSMGDYYFALLHGRGRERVSYILKRFGSSLMAKFYLKRPWFIPFRIYAELRGFISAMMSYRAGQLLLNAPTK